MNDSVQCLICNKKFKLIDPEVFNSTGISNFLNKARVLYRKKEIVV